MRIAGLILALLWALLWVSFEGAEAAGSGQPTQAVLFAVLMLGAAAVAWRWPLWGGALLILEAVAATVLFAPMWLRRMGAAEIAILFSVMCAPPLIAGILLILSARAAPKVTG